MFQIVPDNEVVLPTSFSTVVIVTAIVLSVSWTIAGLLYHRNEVLQRERLDRKKRAREIAKDRDVWYLSEDMEQDLKKKMAQRKNTKKK